MTKKKAKRPLKKRPTKQQPRATTRDQPAEQAATEPPVEDEPEDEDRAEGGEAAVEADDEEEAPAADEGDAPTVLERRARLSRSLLWRLHRRYFLRAGVEAWSSGAVPHYVTSNPFMARAYAEVALAFLTDHLLGAPGALDDPTPIHIVELGAGSGRLAYHFLRAFLPLWRSSPLRRRPFVYVMTDLPPRNVERWQAMPALARLADEGVLDFAELDAESADEIVLRRSGRRLGPGSSGAPLIALANYFFDAVPADAFVVDGGQLRELLLTLATRNPPGDPEEALLDGLEQEVEQEETSADRYDDPAWNAILRGYQERLRATQLTFPTTALRCCRTLRDWSDGRLLLLSADKGSLDEPDDRPSGRLPFAIHGNSLSVDVNYHAIAEYFTAQGGRVLRPQHDHSSVLVGAYLLGAHPGAYPETARAFERHVGSFGPDDFFLVKKIADRGFAGMTLDEALAFLRLTGADSHVILQHQGELLEKTRNCSPSQRADLRRLVHQSWAGYLDIGERADVAFSLGLLLLDAGEHGDAIAYFERSLARPDQRHVALFNLALCHYRLGRPAIAHRYCQAALEERDDYEPALSLARATAPEGETAP